MDKTSERQVNTALLSCLFVPGVCLLLPCFPLPVVGLKYEARYRDNSEPEVRSLKEIVPSMSWVLCNLNLWVSRFGLVGDFSFWLSQVGQH